MDEIKELYKLSKMGLNIFRTTRGEIVQYVMRKVKAERLTEVLFSDRMAFLSGFFPLGVRGDAKRARVGVIHGAILEQRIIPE